MSCRLEIVLTAAWNWAGGRVSDVVRKSTNNAHVLIITIAIIVVRHVVVIRRGHACVVFDAHKYSPLAKRARTIIVIIIVRIN